MKTTAGEVGRKFMESHIHILNIPEMSAAPTSQTCQKRRGANKKTSDQKHDWVSENADDRIISGNKWE